MKSLLLVCFIGMGLTACGDDSCGSGAGSDRSAAPSVALSLNASGTGYVPDLGEGCSSSTPRKTEACNALDINDPNYCGNP